MRPALGSRRRVTGPGPQQLPDTVVEGQGVGVLGVPEPDGLGPICLEPPAQLRAAVLQTGGPFVGGANLARRVVDRDPEFRQGCRTRAGQRGQAAANRWQLIGRRSQARVGNQLLGALPGLFLPPPEGVDLTQGRRQLRQLVVPVLSQRRQPGEPRRHRGDLRVEPGQHLRGRSSGERQRVGGADPPQVVNPRDQRGDGGPGRGVSLRIETSGQLLGSLHALGQRGQPGEKGLVQHIAGHHYLADLPEGGLHAGAELFQGDRFDVFGHPGQPTHGQGDHRPRHLDRRLHKQVTQLGELAVAEPDPPRPDRPRGSHHRLVSPEVLPQASEDVAR
jgi:hypothetical protein